MLRLLPDQMDGKAADFFGQVNGVQGAVRLIFCGFRVKGKATGFEFCSGGRHIGRADGDVAVLPL